MLATLFSTFLALLLTPTAGATPFSPASADSVTVADTTLALAEITVTATRLQTARAEAPARVDVFDRETMEQTGARSVADVLGQQSGAFVRRYGPSGIASLSLRGAGASQTLILLDGHRIGDPQLGQLDLSLLPTALLESVEVLHGAGSPLYGSDAMGGIVHLRTRPPTRDLNWRLSGGYGAFGEREGSALMSGNAGSLSFAGMAAYAASEGNFPYENTALFPPREVRRANADREQVSAYSSATYQGRGVQSRLSGWFSQTERGLPGTASSTTAEERMEDRHLRLWSDHDVRLGAGRLRLGGLLQHSARRYLDPRQDLDQTGRTLVGSLESELRLPVGSHWLLGSGATGSYSRGAHPSLSNAAAEWHGGAFIYGTGHYGPLRLFPALRADGYWLPGQDVRRTALSPRLGANLLLFGGLHAKASAGRTFRMPTFNDRFWQPGGQPDLQPERGWTADAGLFFEHGTQQAELTAYLRRTRDEITWEPSGRGYWAPRNLRQTRTLGLEASYGARWTLSKLLHLDGRLRYTLTDARDYSDAEARSYAQQLRYVPREQLKGQLTATAGRLAVDISARYTGRRPVTIDGSQHLEPHIIVDAQARYMQPLGSLALQVTLGLENVLDTDYAIVQGYPMPPRHARLRLTLSPRE